MPTPKKSGFITVFPDSARFFKDLRWPHGKKQCIRCADESIYTLKTGRLRCKSCGLTFGDFTRTYIGQLNVPINEIAHLLYLFSLGLPVYRCRHYITISLKTAHRAYTVFRKAIYDTLHKEFNDAMDAHPGIKDCMHSLFEMNFNKKWESEDHQVFFGIIVISDTVFAFPISAKEKSEVLKITGILQRRPLLYNSDQGYCVATLPVSDSHLIIQKMVNQKSGMKINPKIESFWTYLIEHLYHYHGISIPHYHLYVKEIEYRYKNRTKDIFHPLAKILVQPVENKSKQPGLKITK